MRYQRPIQYPATESSRLAKLKRRAPLHKVGGALGGIILAGAGIWMALQEPRPDGPRASAEPAAAAAVDKFTEKSDTAPAPPPRLERHDSQRLPFEPRVPSMAGTPESLQGPTDWLNTTVRAGDTLSKIFSRLTLSQTDLASVLAAPGAGRRLHNLAIGQTLQYRTDSRGLTALSYRVDDFSTLVVERTGAGFEAKLNTITPEIRYASATGIITRSLFQDALGAGVPERLILDYAELFGWDVDFVRDLRRGDRFKLVFEEVFRDGEKVQTGRILAAEFASATGKVLRTFWYEQKDGTGGYFSENGEAMKKAFLLAPLKFTTISSRFNLARKHPILNRIRAHKGVDYAAPMGTSVRAVANGRVEFVGQQPGYGNVIVLKHGDRYSTLYGHLMKFASGMRQGGAVSQGDLIGYVGKTGLATGPHLHYEFRIGGVHVDPLTVKLPRSLPLESRYLADFKKKTTGLQSQLAALENKPSDVSRAVVSRAGGPREQQGSN